MILRINTSHNRSILFFHANPSILITNDQKQVKKQAEAGSPVNLWFKLVFYDGSCPTELNSIQLLGNQKPESMNLNIFLPIRRFGNLCHTSENTHIKMVLSNSFEIKCLVLPSLE